MKYIYVRNIAYAHLLAARSLMDDHGRAAGQAYLLTDGSGSNFFIFFDKVVEGAGYRIRPKNLRLPRWVTYFLGIVSELIALLVRPVKYYNPKLSRFAVTYTCTDFTFSSDKAARDFGFKPKYSKEEVLERTVW